MGMYLAPASFHTLKAASMRWVLFYFQIWAINENINTQIKSKHEKDLALQVVKKNGCLFQ